MSRPRSPAAVGRLPTGPPASTAGPNALIDRGYREGDLLQSTSAATSANSAVVGECASFGPKAQTQPQTSNFLISAPTSQNSEWRVGNDPGCARQEQQRIAGSNDGFSPA